MAPNEYAYRNLQTFTLEALTAMTFSNEQVDELRDGSRTVLEDLQGLIEMVIVEGQPMEYSSPVREHLLQGAGRRLRTVQRSIDHIFNLFPPDQKRPLNLDVLSDVQIYLHAFVTNLYGLYDNWAWAFILRHDLLARVGGRRNVGLFLKATQTLLPAEIRSYLTSTTLTKWHDEYAKSFRDALAHRIPPYIPPAEYSQEEGRRYNELEVEKVLCIKGKRWERLSQVWEEQGALGRPSFVFLHAYTEDAQPNPILLHPQLISDGMTAVEFGQVFLKHWHETA